MKIDIYRYLDTVLFSTSILYISQKSSVQQYSKIASFYIITTDPAHESVPHSGFNIYRMHHVQLYRLTLYLVH